MKIKPLKIIGALFKITAPVATAIIAGPETGALVAGALGVGTAVKYGGKALEGKTGLRLHKVAAPAVAVVTPAVLAPALFPHAIPQICAVIDKACSSDFVLALVPGVVAWLAHAIGHGVGSVKKE